MTAQDAADGEYRLAVHPSVASALRRAFLLVPHDLCTWIDLGVVDDPAARLQIVRVYGEG